MSPDLEKVIEDIESTVADGFDPWFDIKNAMDMDDMDAAGLMRIASLPFDSQLDTRRVTDMVASHPKLENFMIPTIIKNGTRRTAAILARRDDLTAGSIKQVYTACKNSNNIHSVACLAANPKTPDAILTSMSKHKNPAVQALGLSASGNDKALRDVYFNMSEGARHTLIQIPLTAPLLSLLNNELNLDVDNPQQEAEKQANHLNEMIRRVADKNNVPSSLSLTPQEMNDEHLKREKQDKIFELTNRSVGRHSSHFKANSSYVKSGNLERYTRAALGEEGLKGSVHISYKEDDGKFATKRIWGEIPSTNKSMEWEEQSSYSPEDVGDIHHSLGLR